MKKFVFVRFVLVMLVAVLSAETGWPQQLRDQPKGAQARRPNAQPRRAALQQVVLGFYIAQLRRVAEVSDDVFVKVLPSLEQFVRDRFEITDRRRRAFVELQNVINTGGPDEDVRRLVRELDSANSEIYSNEQSFLRNVDPLLNTRQQANLRIFLDTSDQRIRQILNGIQNPAAAPPPNRQNSGRGPNSGTVP